MIENYQILRYAVLCVVVVSAATAAYATTPAKVKPIDWSQYDASLASQVAPNSLMGINGQILLNNTRYNYDWIPTFHHYSAASNSYIPNPSVGNVEARIRSGAMAAFGISTVITTNLYAANPASLGGASLQDLRTRNAQLIKGIASSHRANNLSNQWGDDWQAALWAAELGQAAWMVWDDLDATAQQYVVRMVEHEANRFLEPGYQVPFWNPSGGNSLAEENAWNAMIMQTAVAMMPGHVHANEWRQRGSELMVTAFSRPSDQNSSQMVDGRPVSQWISGRGYNIREDGVVINHSRIHPDYMATTVMNTRAYLTQSLAGQTVPESAGYNAQVVWESLTGNSFSSPPYQSPGGTIYRVGEAEVYYPEATDWSPRRVDIFYLTDAAAEILGYDSNTPDAKDWMQVRGEYILAMQNRGGGLPGQTYRNGDWVRDWGPKEQQVSWQMGEAYLLQWLAAQNAIEPTGNWIPDVFVRDPGFENTALSTGQLMRFNQQSTIGSWSLLSGPGHRAGVQNFVNNAEVGIHFDPSHYNGNHKALYINALNGEVVPVISQTLDATLQPDLLYVLSLDVGSRGQALDDLESYRIQFLAGGVLLAEMQESDPGAPLLVDMQFTTVTLQFNSGEMSFDLSLLGTQLEIRLTNPLINPHSQLSQTIFDNIFLTATAVPEGNTLAMGLWASLVSFFWLRRRSNVHEEAIP